MPWCETCSRFWNPGSVGTGGECPTCGRSLPLPKGTRPATATAVDDGVEEAEQQQKAPWHFRLLLVAVVLYLGFRAWQGIVWVVEQF